MLAKTFLLMGAPRPARYHFDQLARASALDSDVLESIRAEAEIGLAWIALDLDRSDTARLHADRAATIYRRIGSPSGLATVARFSVALTEATGAAP